MEPKQQDKHTCPYHEQIQKTQERRNLEMEKLWDSQNKKLSTNMFLWIFAIAFGVLISLSGLNYEKLTQIQICVATITTRLERNETNIDKNTNRIDSFIRDLNRHENKDIRIIDRDKKEP